MCYATRNIDGSRIATPGMETTARISDAGATYSSRRSSQNTNRDYGQVLHIEDDEEGIWNLLDTASMGLSILSPDGTRRISVIEGWSDGCTANLWDEKTGTKVAQFQGPHRWVDWVAFSKNGLQIIIVSLNGYIRIWEAAPWWNSEDVLWLL